MFIKAANVFIIFILCIVPLIMIPGAIDVYYSPKITAVYTGILVLLLAFVFRKNKTNVKMLKKCNSAEILLFLYGVLITLSAVFSINKEKAFLGSPFREEGAIALLSYIFIFFITSYFYKFKENHVRYLLFSALIIALYGILQFFDYNPIALDVFRRSWSNHSYSTMGNRNFLGSYLSLIMPLSIFLCVYKRSIVQGAVSCILFMSLLCTLTRGAWLSFIVYFFIVTIITFIKKLDYKYIIVLGIVMMIMAFSFNYYTGGVIFSRFISINQDISSAVLKSDDNSGSMRFFIWKRTVKLIGDRPLFGSGPDAFEDVFMERYGDEVKRMYGNIIFDKAHNEYLQNTITLGIPAAVIYVFFIAVVLYHAIKKGTNDKKIIVPILAITGYVVQAFFNISVVSVAPVFWVFLGVANNFTKSNYE